MIVRFRRGNMTETRPVHGKLDHHVSAARKRDGYKQRPVSVEFTKYGNRLFRPVQVLVLCKAFKHDFRRFIIADLCLLLSASRCCVANMFLLMF